MILEWHSRGQAVMTRLTTEIIDAEREFNVDELFFSITDKRGIIEQYNEVFLRISGYTADEVLGAPHSILRHPDMPRVVFKLLWDTIEKGESIAAYVKNLAKDGKHYWVLALVIPTDRGYLSVRLKPTSELFPIVQKIYGDLLHVERVIETEPKRRKEAMAASAEKLQSLLKKHGFDSYTSFMHHALSTEMTARDRILKKRNADSSSAEYATDSATHRNLFNVIVQCEQLDKQLHNLFNYLDEFRSMNVMLLNRSRSMLDNAAVIRLLSLNATVSAAQLGSRAATLGVVAESLGDASTQSERIIDAMSDKMNALVETLSGLMFDVATIKLQSEVSNQFLLELQRMSLTGGDDVIHSLCTLLKEVSNRTADVYERLHYTESSLNELRKSIEMLLKNIRTLRFVQFTGLKESAALEGARAFAVVFEEAHAQIEKTRSECDELRKIVDDNQKHIRTIQVKRPQVLSHVTELLTWTQTASIH